MTPLPSIANSNDELPKSLSPESAQNSCGMRMQDSTARAVARALFLSELTIGVFGVVGLMLAAVKILHSFR
jgi:hypothetical protein